jgi:hypothetical protein
VVIDRGRAAAMAFPSQHELKGCPNPVTALGHVSAPLRQAKQNHLVVAPGTLRTPDPNSNTTLDLADFATGCDLRHCRHAHFTQADTHRNAT